MERKMRTLKISLLVFILTITVSAQWYQQNSGTTADLMGVSFTDQNIGTAVGDNVILRTTDGGANWFSRTNGTTIGLLVFRLQMQILGTVVGGHIFRTTDGGTTWNLQTNPTNNSMWGVSFSDSDNGTAVGQVGKFIRTTNGGATWTLQTSGSHQWFERGLFY